MFSKRAIEDRVERDEEDDAAGIKEAGATHN
jgi:hypothetical protein